MINCDLVGKCPTIILGSGKHRRNSNNTVVGNTKFGFKVTMPQIHCIVQSKKHAERL